MLLDWNSGRKLDSLDYFFFWWIKRNILREKRHFKEAPQRIQEVYKRERKKKKKTFNQGLTNQQNLQRKWDQKQKNP